MGEGNLDIPVPQILLTKLPKSYSTVFSHIAVNWNLIHWYMFFILNKNWEAYWNNFLIRGGHTKGRKEDKKEGGEWGAEGDLCILLLLLVIDLFLYYIISHNI